MSLTVRLSGLWPSRQTRDVLQVLVESDLRARYGRGPWQLLKWLVDPFALVGIYLLLVTVLLDRGGPAPGLSLACAIVPFQIVMLVVTNTFTAVKLRRGIVGNMAFARMLIPVAGALTETLAFGASLVLLALMMAIYGVAPTGAIVALPLIMLINVLLALALGYAITLIGLWVSDLGQFVVSFVRALYFVAPGLVALDDIGGRAHELLRINPLTGLFEGYRQILLHGDLPKLWQIGIPLGAAAVIAAVFVPIYRSEERHFAKVME